MFIYIEISYLVPYDVRKSAWQYTGSHCDGITFFLRTGAFLGFAGPLAFAGGSFEALDACASFLFWARFSAFSSASYRVEKLLR